MNDSAHHIPGNQSFSFLLLSKQMAATDRQTAATHPLRLAAAMDTPTAAVDKLTEADTPMAEDTPMAGAAAADHPPLLVVSELAAAAAGHPPLLEVLAERRPSEWQWWSAPESDRQYCPQSNTQSDRSVAASSSQSPSQSESGRLAEQRLLADTRWKSRRQSAS